MNEFHYLWKYELQSSPEELWELVANTNRFNRDTNLPPVQVLTEAKERRENARKVLQFHRFGLSVKWTEEPFEWVRPYRFGVVRHYSKGPVDQMQVKASLTATDDGTHLEYEVWARPANVLGYIAIPLQIGLISARQFRQVFHRYDDFIQSKDWFIPQERVNLNSDSRQRIKGIRQQLLETNRYSEVLIDNLINLVESADELTVSQIRPYILADYWNAPRKKALELCLDAAKIGLLDLRWHLLCPLCRVDRKPTDSMKDISDEVHCHTCNIDFEANFATSVELTFHPNRAIRSVNLDQDFCVAGPQITPHVIAQQKVEPGEVRTIEPKLEEGRYRIRALELKGSRALHATEDGQHEITQHVPKERFAESEELKCNPAPKITFENNTGTGQLLILERMAWTDDAVMAADVIALQRFRNLFSEEILRPGQEISVGSMAMVFTDIRDSTEMYRKVGDATAFGIVMDHFDLLRTHIDEARGAIVKTIGDAIMAVFTNPGNAVNALLKSQTALKKQDPEIVMRAGIHYGPCIAINQNDRIDYFGTTVNVAARLEGYSSGDEVVVSETVYDDPDVQRLINSSQMSRAVTQESTEAMKGFEGEKFHFWKIAPRGFTNSE